MSFRRRGVSSLPFWLAILVVGAFNCAGPPDARAQVTRVSVSSLGVLSNGDSDHPAISGDGRLVIFSSAATTLTTEASPGIFVHDRHLAQTSRTATTQSDIHQLSRDGRFALIPANDPAAGLVVIDRVTGQHWTVPPVATPLSSVAELDWPMLAAEGGHVAFLGDERVSPHSGNLDAWGVYVWNRLNGQVCDAHRSTGGVPGNAPVGTVPHGAVGVGFNGPAVSADGRRVVFTSPATNLVPADTNSTTDVFVHDCVSGVTTRVSQGPGGAEADGHSARPTISGSGRFIAFSSRATNLTAQGQEGVFIYDVDSGSVELVMNMTGPIVPNLSFSQDGRYLAINEWVAGSFVGFGPRLRIYDRVTRQSRTLLQFSGSAGATFAPNTALSADGRYLTFESATALDANDANNKADAFVIDLFDDDGDTITNDWETFFGLNPASAADAGLDPDGDGRTNVQEFGAGSHPKGQTSATRYFAEGAATDFFDTRIAVANPSTSATASVLLRFVKADGTFATKLVSVPPQRSQHVLVDTLPEVVGSSFATVVETDAPVVADRLMWWGPSGAYGTHSEHSLGGAALSWHFAEGATHSGFELFYLVLNANPTPASVRVRYLLPSGAPLERTYTVPGNSRFNIWVDQELFGGVAALANTDVSAVFEVQNSVPVMVERAMYLTPPVGLTFTAGHASAGVTAPSTTWFFAEGATGTYFDEYVLVANPGASASTVRATYLLDSGITYQKTYTVPAGSRFNIWVDEETIAGQGKVLANAALSVRLEVLSGPAVVAERSMWWPGPTAATWLEAHNVLGSTAAAVRWGFAEGAVSGAPGNADTYFLIANPTTGAATVRVTLLFNDGTSAVSKTYPVAATSRFNVHVRAEFPAALDRLFGAVVESIDATPVAIVVERAVYNDANGVHWAAGTAALGTPVP